MCGRRTHGVDCNCVKKAAPVVSSNPFRFTETGSEILSILRERDGEPIEYMAVTIVVTGSIDDFMEPDNFSDRLSFFRELFSATVIDAKITNYDPQKDYTN